MDQQDPHAHEEDDDMAEEDFDWGDEAATLGDRLALARQYAGMDQTALARRLGVKLATVRNWETDRSEPRANRLQMLAGLLGVSIMWLMAGEGEGGPVDEGEAVMAPEMAAMVKELRDIRVAQLRLAERAGRAEKRLRALITGG